MGLVLYGIAMDHYIMFDHMPEQPMWKTVAIDDANPFIFIMDGECVVRINREYEVAMGLARGEDGEASSAGEGPGGRHVLKSKIND